MDRASFNDLAVAPETTSGYHSSRMGITAPGSDRFFMSTFNPTQVAEHALALLKRHGQRLDEFLVEVIRRNRAAPPRLLEAMEYSLTAGGKRIRPALVLECAAACAAESHASASDDVRLRASENRSALAAAAAIELIHTFSLVHDDLPAMDDDDLRRGRPTNHKVYGEAMAILAGDAMVSAAFELIATDAEPAIAARLIAELAHSTGPEGMIGGQVLDMEGEGKSLSLDQLKQLHRMKTGALLRSACRLGAIAAGAAEAQIVALSEYGRQLGLAFQIIDDLLDVTSTPEQMGKATGKDAAKGKNTYPSLLGLEASEREARLAVDLALNALSAFGQGAQGLRDLALFVVDRQH